VSEFRYLGVFIVSSRSFKYSLVYAKRSFYAAVNGLFGKLLNLASEEVILELLRTKRTPILLYGLECFKLGKADQHSLDFTFNRLCMKLFKTGSIDLVKDSQSYCAIDLPSCDLKRRQDKFILRYVLYIIVCIYLMHSMQLKKVASSFSDGVCKCTITSRYCLSITYGVWCYARLVHSGDVGIRDVCT